MPVNPTSKPKCRLLYERYAQAAPPRKGKSASIAYRMRNLFLDRWNLWPRLTYYRTWKDPEGKPFLDGTNNADERAIGWWVKERYRTMRGYKRDQSVLNVSRLIAYCGNHLSKGLDLANDHCLIFFLNRFRAPFCSVSPGYQFWNSHK